MSGMRPVVGTMSRIVRHIAGVRVDAIFTTRDCLNYGTRASVDKVLSRLVKRKIIIRIAWGVFMKAGSKVPGIDVIAGAKAKAFGKEIAQHAIEISKQIQARTRVAFHADALLDRVTPTRSNKRIQARAVFAVSGRTSSFVSQNVRVHLIGVSLRKMQLSQSKAGKLLLALMQLGEEHCGEEHILAVNRLLSGLDVQEIRRSGALMPAWLAQFWIRNR